MSALRAAIVLAAGITAACGEGDSDLNVQGTVTSSATQAVIVDAQVALYYQAVAVLDPGVILARTDAMGKYSMHGREALCEGLSMRVTATGFLQSAAKFPVCEEALQTIDFSLQPVP